jgi:hypothetical protein
MVISLRLLVALVLLGFIFPVAAWNGVGHMVVAQIAHNHLDPIVKAKCDALIATAVPYGTTANNTFVTASCWADDAKVQLGTGEWHYIDYLFSLDGTPASGVAPQTFDIVRAIDQCVAVVRNTNAVASDRAINLRYIIHFIGDIHQPLHTTALVSSNQPNGDAGGNLFYTSGQWNNLHSMWDAGCGYLTNVLSRPLSVSGQTWINQTVAKCEAQHPYVNRTNRVLSSLELALEGFDVAKKVVYTNIVRSSTPTPAYLSKGQQTAEQRLAQAGYQLADLLNQTIASNPVRIESCSAANSTLTLRWNTTPGTGYRVQWKQNLSDPMWTTLTNITAASVNGSFEEPVSASQRFYRVVQ